MRNPPWLLAPLVCVLALPLCAAERLDAHQVFRGLQPALSYLDFVWAQVEGDLNGDGIPDVAMLLTGSRDESAAREERVVVLVGTPNGGYRVLSVSGDFCHPSKFYELDIHRGALLVGMVETADGRQWGSTTLRLRYNAKMDDLELIGEDTRSENFETGEQELGSTNLLTGQSVSTTRIGAKTKTSTRRLKTAARPVLNGWACER